MFESRALKHLSAATQGLISLPLPDKTTQYVPGMFFVFFELHSPLYGHQLPSLIALAQEHAAIRAVPQLLQRGVAVHRPQRALPLLHRGALTVPHSPTVGHCKHSNIPPQINDLYAALSCCYCEATQRLLL